MNPCASIANVRFLSEIDVAASLRFNYQLRPVRDLKMVRICSARVPPLRHPPNSILNRHKINLPGSGCFLSSAYADNDATFHNLQVLLHEMIHAHNMTLRIRDPDPGGHGPPFVELMNNINNSSLPDPQVKGGPASKRRGNRQSRTRSQ